MRTAFIAQQQGVALAIVAGIVRLLGYTHQPTIRILAPSGRNTFADNSTAGILSKMNHLCTGICLLIVVGDRHTVKFRRRVVTGKDARGIFPGNGRTGFHLCPGQFAVYALAVPALRYKVIDAALTFGISRIPVLNGTVFHFGTVVYHNLHNSGVQLVFVTHRRRTSFQIGNIRIIIGYNQRSFKLPGIAGIDTEVSGQLHRAAYPFRYIDERTVGEYRGIQRRKEVITIPHDRAQILLHQIGMLAYSLAERTENNSLFHKRLLESRLYRHRVHYGIHRHTAQRHLFFQRNAQFIKGLDQLRVYLVHAFRAVLLLGRIGVV